MAYSATLANSRGLLSDQEHERLLSLFSTAGLSIDHAQFDEHILEKGTAAILKTRDGLLRLAVPETLGSCVFLNDVSTSEMKQVLRVHKNLAAKYPRGGAGIEAYVDESDMGAPVCSPDKHENEYALDAAGTGTEELRALLSGRNDKKETKEPRSNGLGSHTHADMGHLHGVSKQDVKAVA